MANFIHYREHKQEPEKDTTAAAAIKVYFQLQLLQLVWCKQHLIIYSSPPPPPQHACMHKHKHIKHNTHKNTHKHSNTHTHTITHTHTHAQAHT